MKKERKRENGNVFENMRVHYSLPITHIHTHIHTTLQLLVKYEGTRSIDLSSPHCNKPINTFNDISSPHLPCPTPVSSIFNPF